jgi:hypothetical protein
MSDTKSGIIAGAPGGPNVQAEQNAQRENEQKTHEAADKQKADEAAKKAADDAAAAGDSRLAGARRPMTDADRAAVAPPPVAPATKR